MIKLVLWFKVTKSEPHQKIKIKARSKFHPDGKTCFFFTGVPFIPRFPSRFKIPRSRISSAKKLASVQLAFLWLLNDKQKMAYLNLPLMANSMNPSWFVFLRLRCILHGLSFTSRPSRETPERRLFLETSSKAHTQRRKQNQTPPLGWSELVAPHRSHIRLGRLGVAKFGMSTGTMEPEKCRAFSLKKSWMMTFLAGKKKTFEWNRSCKRVNPF